MKSHDFNIEGFSKTIQFTRRHFQTTNFNCTAAEVTEANLKTSAYNWLFVYLWSAEIFFCLRPRTKRFPFSFQNAEWAGNFVVSSPKVSLRIISFRRPFGLPLWNFGRPRVNCRRLWRPLGSSLVIIVVFLLRPFTSKREIKIEPDLRLTLEQDSSCVKLITKSYTTGFLNNLLFRGWLFDQFLR